MDRTTLPSMLGVNPAMGEHLTQNGVEIPVVECYKPRITFNGMRKLTLREPTVHRPDAINLNYSG